MGVKKLLVSSTTEGIVVLYHAGKVSSPSRFSALVLQQGCSSSSVTTFRGLLGRFPALEQVGQFALYFRDYYWSGRMPGYLR
jgi:hypothetical protein